MFKSQVTNFSDSMLKIPCSDLMCSPCWTKDSSGSNVDKGSNSDSVDHLMNLAMDVGHFYIISTCPSLFNIFQILSSEHQIQVHWRHSHLKKNINYCSIIIRKHLKNVFIILFGISQSDLLQMKLLNGENLEGKLYTTSSHKQHCDDRKIMCLIILVMGKHEPGHQIVP